MQSKFKNLLIDFDGTIIDSGPGIISTLEYMFVELGEKLPSKESLRSCIGPGLQQVCRNLFPNKDEEFIKKAVITFRKKYDQEGYLGSEFYPGIEALLLSLKESNYNLYLTTMKARSGVESLLKHLKLEDFFRAVYASDPYGPALPKFELISSALKGESLQANETAIIGDTHHDVEAGKRNQLFTIGVAWGYGTTEELSKSGADVICHSIGELGRYLMP